MNSGKWNTKQLLSVFFLIIVNISFIFGNSRNKRAPALGGHLTNNSESLVNNFVPKFIKPQAVGGSIPENTPQNVEWVKPKKNGHVNIAESEECAENVKRFCSDKISNSNFLVLDCLQNSEKTESKLSDSCHHYLWMYKLNLTQGSIFEDASSEACSPDLLKIRECNGLKQGEVIPCLLEHYVDVKSSKCSSFLNKMASIIFSDYRFMQFFIHSCTADIQRLNCGRLDNEDDSPHSQGMTVTCLHGHRKDLNKECTKSLLRVAELQSDDFHLDRPLYYACKDDRESLCEHVEAGQGAVFKCLYKHLGDPRLSDHCRSKLENRQQLIAEDVKIDKSFYAACKKDIKENECTIHGHRGGGSIEEDLSRTTTLLCLEEAQAEKKSLKPECLLEMLELRAQLMEDYKVNPELISACQREIEKFCPLKHDVMQCLMKGIAEGRRHQTKNITFSSECTTEVTSLVQVINPGEDIQIDAPLSRACGDVITHACSSQHAGPGDIITCLLENLDHEDMTDECENELLVIQYFAVRNFRLDFHLFQQCHDDAVKLCNSNGFNDPSTMKPDEGPITFSCLHRHLRSDNPHDEKPSRACTHEIKRVLRERSFRVNLMPEVEAACLEDLSRHCSDEEEHKKYSGEMECLQSILEDLTEECRHVVNNFTLEEAEDIELDRTLIRYCTPMAKKFCAELLDSDALANEVLDCLISFKNHNLMDEKCAANIEHHQIVLLTDFHFNIKFHSACQDSVLRFCTKKRTKYDVVACLSETIRNDTIEERPQRIDDRCRRQLRSELLQRGETIELDVGLKKNCRTEITNFCQSKRHGEGQTVECLRAHRDRLGDACYKVLFQREKDDAIFGDYTLLHLCKTTITKYCDPEADEADILKCLIENKDNQDDFDDRCRQVVQQRQIEQARDIELDPSLQKACRLDILKFCSSVLKDRTPGDIKTEGRVIDCLKKTYASKKKVLSPECKHEVQSRIKEAAMNINLNPVLMRVCQTDIYNLCLKDIANLKVEGKAGYQLFSAGVIMECLKKNFRDLKDTICKKEVAYSIVESRVDVHVDPLLHASCQQNLLSHCNQVARGQGRQMKCLLDLMEKDPSSLTSKCLEILKSRRDLWQAAAQVAPAESFSEIFDQMTSSSARNYFFAILFTVVGIIFIFGLTCGRVTKRVRAEIKNK